ncbi:MAG: pyridoxal phosphate-dependent aminotransferase, partial [Candidatus Heimdallarchaeota archaeon]|nr:pyridoxal phosphate-dependent aminotransferase [Candidatus Heimdallarchaeota archaeon]
MASVEGSVTAQIFAKARQLEFAGKDIVHLEIGQPDFKPHPVILQGVADAVLAGNTSYTVSRGTLDFRKEIGNYHKQVNKSNLNPATEIVVTSGAKLALFGSLWGLINPGDNIIVLNPSWVSYSDIIMSLGGEVKWVDVDHNFNYDENELRSEINDRTKAILVNSPSNPTGSVISQVGISTLFDICAESGIYLISDEIYSEYLYDGKIHSSLLDINNWMDHGIVVNGLSKTFSMTGFRLGYTLANEQISNNVN